MCCPLACILMDWTRVTYITFRNCTSWTIYDNRTINPKCIPISLKTHSPIPSPIYIYIRTIFSNKEMKERREEEKTIKTPEKSFRFLLFAWWRIFYITTTNQRIHNIWEYICSPNKSLTTSSFVIYFSSGVLLYIDEPK